MGNMRNAYDYIIYTQTKDTFRGVHFVSVMCDQYGDRDAYMVVNIIIVRDD